MCILFFRWLAAQLAPHLAELLRIEALQIVEEMTARMEEKKQPAQRKFIGKS